MSENQGTTQNLQDTQSFFPELRAPALQLLDDLVEHWLRTAPLGREVVTRMGVARAKRATLSLLKQGDARIAIYAPDGEITHPETAYKLTITPQGRAMVKAEGVVPEVRS